jgi:hypothetical protein
MHLRFGVNEAGPACLPEGVGMTTMAAEQAIFENEDWLVTEDGLEHKTTGYFIERESLANRRDDGLWSWPLHMAEKSWCSMTAFAEAFTCAASVYNIETGAELAQTFKMARGEIAVWPKPSKRNENPAPLVRPILHSAEPNPILWEAGRAEKPAKTLGSYASDENLRRPFLTGARVFSANTRLRDSHMDMARTKALPWRTSRRIQKTGTKLVRLFQAAWSIR